MQKFRGSLLAPSIALAALAAASSTQNGISAPGGYVTALAGNNNGAAPNAGGNFENSMYAGQYDIEDVVFSPTSASASASYSVGSLQAEGSGFASFGTLRLGGTSSGTNDLGHFGGATGGWADTFTIDLPGLTGQAGRMVYTLSVDGHMHTTGFAGAARTQLIEYKDKQLVPRDAIFNALNDPVGVSTDRQQKVYGLASDFSTEDRVVDDTVTFTVPFVYGTKFELGIFAAAYAGFRSTSGVGGISTSLNDFNNTITWGGVSQMLDASGNTISGYTLMSGSGANWINPVPEPATMVTLGLGALAALRRRKRA